MLGNTTIRARCAFVLAVAEHALPLLSNNSEFFALAREALDSAWKWVRGGKVAADMLYDYLENRDDETRLLIYEYESLGNEKAGSLVITIAIAYVIWHVYRQEGGGMSSPFCEVTEETIEQIIDFAKKTPSYDSQLVNDLVTRCLALYKN